METIQREKSKGNHNSPDTEFKKGDIPWNKGKIGVYSKEVLEKMNKGKKGRKLTKEHKEKLKGRTPWNKGQKHLQITGENHFNWKGGISKNPKYRSFLQTRRMVRKKQNGGSHTLEEWENLKGKYNYTCPCCGQKEPEIILTEDHIIPLKSKGTDNINNIQPLCGKCNSTKQGRFIKFEILCQI